MTFKKVLAIETSCDDTSVAVVGANGQVFSVVSADQDLQHQPFGGVVPEIASRNHTLQILPLVDQCLKSCGMGFSDIDGIAVTSRPGLVGSLIVGVVSAKTLAWNYNLPVVGVNHLEGHLLAPFLRDESHQPPHDFDFPFVGLAVSGGHTQLYLVKGVGEYEVLGKTLDDAAGEAFDKFAKLVGLGFPGGVAVDRMASTGDASKFQFPRALKNDGTLNYSFSGLKTSAQNVIQKLPESQLEQMLPDLCASYQEAIVEALMHKLNLAVEQQGVKRAIVTGGVSANSRLRKAVQDWAKQNGIQTVIPPLRYCTDNAAMIGYAGILRLNRGEASGQDLIPSPRSYEGDFQVGVSR